MRTRTRIGIELVLLSLLALELSGCAGKERRTKNSDAQLRIALDSYKVDGENYTAISRELLDTGKFVVVDRGRGFKAVKAEQSMENVDERDRFAPNGRYAEYGKLYGVGSVVVASGNCDYKDRLFGSNWRCVVQLSLYHAVTGELLIAVTDHTTAKNGHEIDWHDVVEKLVDRYPEYFETSMKTERLLWHEQQLAIKAKEMEEINLLNDFIQGKTTEAP